MRKVCKKVIIVPLALLPCTILHAQDYSLYRKKLFISDKDTLRYRILFPLHMDSGKKYPLLIYFHGSAKRGKDNEVQLKCGADLFLKKENREKYPAFIVYPQCPADSTWVHYTIRHDQISTRHFIIPVDTPPATPLRLSAELITQLIREKPVDKSRIYIGGQSLGGLATFDMLWRYPGCFAAAFPIAGAGNPEAVRYYNKGTAVWIFHGKKDHVVPYINSKIMYKAMKNKGMKVRYTLYPQALHNSWDSAFSEKRLLPWLFSKQRH